MLYCAEANVSHVRFTAAAMVLKDLSRLSIVTEPFCIMRGVAFMLCI